MCGLFVASAARRKDYTWNSVDSLCDNYFWVNQLYCSISYIMTVDSRAAGEFLWLLLTDDYPMECRILSHLALSKKTGFTLNDYFLDLRLSA